MSRHREFCPEHALSKALDVFWREGFDGASITNLTEAMEITRPSLYSAFGNKEALFRKALDLYYARHMTFVSRALEESDVHRMVSQLLMGFAELHTSTDHPPGCLGINSVRGDDATVRREIQERRTDLETSLRARFESAAAAGKLRSDADPADLAGFLVMVVGGMALKASTGCDRLSLQRLANVALQALPTPP